jgi:hypothetical protein
MTIITPTPTLILNDPPPPPSPPRLSKRKIPPDFEILSLLIVVVPPPFSAAVSVSRNSTPSPEQLSDASHRSSVRTVRNFRNSLFDVFLVQFCSLFIMSFLSFILHLSSLPPPPHHHHRRLSMSLLSLSTRPPLSSSPIFSDSSGCGLPSSLHTSLERIAPLFPYLRSATKSTMAPSSRLFASIPPLPPPPPPPLPSLASPLSVISVVFSFLSVPSIVRKRMSVS